MRRLVAALGAGVLLLSLVACGSDEKDALHMASEACNDGMLNGTEDYIIKNRQHAADVAAEAARLDPQWNDLADATNTWAFQTKNYYEIVDADGSDTINYDNLFSDLEDVKSQLSSQCRKVVSAGGSVRQSLIDNF